MSFCLYIFPFLTILNIYHETLSFHPHPRANDGNSFRLPGHEIKDTLRKPTREKGRIAMSGQGNPVQLYMTLSKIQ